MKNTIPLELDANYNTYDRFLLRHDVRIQIGAYRAIPRDFFSKDVLDLEIDDFIQTIRIKLWKSLRKGSITSPSAYIRTVAHTTAVDMVRCYKSTTSLSTSEDGEPELSDLLVAQNEGMRDPAYEVEREEIDSNFLAKLIDALLSLPLRQRLSMFYSLREQRNDALPLIDALKERGVDIDVIDFPQEESDIALLRASLPFARKKLQWLREEFISL